MEIDEAQARDEPVAIGGLQDERAGEIGLHRAQLRLGGRLCASRSTSAKISFSEAPVTAVVTSAAHAQYPVPARTDTRL